MATTVNIALHGLQTIDGVATAVGDRVLVKNQATASENGIYTASDGQWYRAADARTSRTIQKGTTVHVQVGMVNENRIYGFQTVDPAIGTDPIALEFYTSAASINLPAIAANTILVADSDASAYEAVRFVSISSYGASTGAGTATNTTAINAAIAYAAGLRIREVYVPDGTFVSNALTNPNGVKLVGPGKIMIGTLSTQYKANSTSDFYDSHYDGLEYLAAVHQALAGQNVCRAALYGDSTVVGVSVTDNQYLPHTLLDRTAFQRGAFYFSTANRGVSGTFAGAILAGLPDFTALGQLNSDLADPETKLIVIKYMVNDPSGWGVPAWGQIGDTVEYYSENMKNLLAYIRAARSVSGLSVVLVTGNSVNDPATGRDQQWFEKAIPVLRKLARDYQCTFVDVYSPFSDAVHAGSWMDDLASDGVHIHPKEIMQAWIWGRVADAVFNRTVMERFGYNAVNVYSSTSLHAATPGALPDNFPYGISIYRATAVQGWPIDGALIVHRTPDQIVSQKLFAYGAGNANGHSMSRYADSVGNSWKRWSRVETALPLSNGWVDYASGWAPPMYSISDDGYVQVQGRIKSGTITANTTVATLPAGFRPSSAIDFVVPTSGGIGQLYVNTDGTVKILSGGDATYTSLNPIRFRAT
ncbi:SGNH/GDSL hydrolase family protein [Mesorhizobium sp. Cs1321R2N1]|uniref:SGNH/GDSL hydrolase family protein n=1 Tax=Mesorhizobium sp. Cs1321R2N1 TaxID=3015174 RepID=UPI00301BB696